MNLKPQDLLVTLKLLALGDSPWKYSVLAESLGLGHGEAHAAAQRALEAGLLVDREGRPAPMRRNLLEFVEHGVRFVFVPDRGASVRGMATAWAAPPLAGLMTGDNSVPPVWPYEKGGIRGESFSPLYRSAPIAAANDPELYELLALVDAIRGGRARERKMALKLFSERIDSL